MCKRQGTGNIRTRRGGFVVTHPFHDETVKWMGHLRVWSGRGWNPANRVSAMRGEARGFPGFPLWRMDREHPDLCLARCGPFAESKKCYLE